MDVCKFILHSLILEASVGLSAPPLFFSRRPPPAARPQLLPLPAYAAAPARVLTAPRPPALCPPTVLRKTMRSFLVLAGLALALAASHEVHESLDLDQGTALSAAALGLERLDLAESVASVGAWGRRRRRRRTF